MAKREERRQSLFPHCTPQKVLCTEVGRKRDRERERGLQRMLRRSSSTEVAQNQHREKGKAEGKTNYVIPVIITKEEGSRKT